MTTTTLAVPDPGHALRLLSLGAGVQSTTVLLLACEGEIPRFDVALFADTGWEPRAVYANLDRLAAHAERHGIPVRQVSAGNIRADALDPRHRFVSMPLHTLNPDGTRGLARRQCTAEYKITPLKKAARELLGYPHPRRVPRGVYAEQAIGISTDEFQVAELANRFGTDLHADTARSAPRDLLADVAEVLGTEPTPAAEVPALLAKACPRWKPYRRLTGKALREQLAAEYGVKVASTGNRWPGRPEGGPRCSGAPEQRGGLSRVRSPGSRTPPLRGLRTGLTRRPNSADSANFSQVTAA